MTTDRQPTPLRALDDEHRLIARALDALGAYADRLEAGQAAPVDHLGRFAEFFTDFAELWHHAKEEDILIPILVREGFGWTTGPVGRMRQEHDQERYLIRVLRQAAAQESEWDSEDRRHAVAAIRAFVDFQRGHIEKEEEVLYPAVVERLPAERLAELEQRFDAFAERHFESGRYEYLRSLIDGLIAEYGGRTGQTAAQQGAT